MSAEDREIAMDKATKAMTAFTNKYLQNTGTSLCTDKSVPAVVIKGLAEHKVTLGAPLCPCRFYEDKEAEAKDGYWNCPCVPMRERHECHCMLFLTEDNPFAGSEQVRAAAAAADADAAVDTIYSLDHYLPFLSHVSLTSYIPYPKTLHKGNRV